MSFAVIDDSITDRRDSSTDFKGGRLNHTSFILMFLKLGKYIMRQICFMHTFLFMYINAYMTQNSKRRCGSGVL